MLRTLTCLGLCLLSVAGCSSEPEPAQPQPECDFNLEWGLRTAGGFAAFSSGDDAELTLGFQGFRYIDSSVRLVDKTAADATVTFQISVAGHDPWAQTFGARITEEEFIDVNVFFHDVPLPELLGRETQISTRVIADGCLGTHSATVTLRDDDECIENEEGELECTNNGS